MQTRDIPSDLLNTEREREKKPGSAQNQQTEVKHDGRLNQSQKSEATTVFHNAQMTNHRPATSREWLFALARIYLGVSFFFSDHGNARPDEVAGFLKYALAHGYSWYAGFLNAVVVSRSAMFGTLVVVVEIYIAIALVLGLTTRLAACLAIFLLLNYLCAKGAVPWGPGIDQSDIILALIILFGNAGRVFGLDAFLHKRFPKIPIW